MKSSKTRQEWTSIIEQYRSSGLSIKQFCIDTDLKPSTLCYWIKKLKETNIKPKLSFVKIPQSSKPEKKLVLEYNGLTIEIPNHISSELITSLISTIRGTI